MSVVEVPSLNRQNKVSFWQGLTTSDYVLTLVIVVYLAIQWHTLSNYAQLPSPIYGGDLYYSLGSVNHVLYGGDPLMSSNVLNSEPGYLPLYAMLVALVAWPLGLSGLVAMKLFSLVQVILGLILFYCFVASVQKNKSLALAATLMYLPVSAFPSLKYTNFAIVVMIPAFLYTMHRFSEQRTVASAIVFGIVFGLIGITHTVAFVTTVFFFVTLSGFLLFVERRSETVTRILCLLVIAGIIASAIALLYWYKPLFVYYGKIQQVHLYTIDLSTFGKQLNFLTDIVRAYLFDFSTILTGLRSSLVLVGLLSLAFVKKHHSMNHSMKYVLMLLAASALGTFHYFLTQPVLGVNLQPGYIALLSLTPLLALLASFGLRALTSFVTMERRNKVIGGIVVILLIIGVRDFYVREKEYTFTATARSPLPPHLLAMAEWVTQNTHINDVFLSTNELNFALNALTGRKQVNGRKSHNSIFLDVDARHAAAAIMLYGNNSWLRKKLIEQYDVKYLYWDSYWLQSDFVFDDRGKLVSWYDPLIVEASPAYEKSMNENSLKFIKQHTWPDPAVRHEGVKKIDLFIILPYEFNPVHPWNPDLDVHLREVWNFTHADRVVSRIYRIVP